MLVAVYLFRIQGGLQVFFRVVVTAGLVEFNLWQVVLEGILLYVLGCVYIDLILRIIDTQRINR